ncbi:hypothetical protein CW745_14965 [Psychromonas sp. psych-6C06]|nr:hypothetical protein CW745_14965 [Psychromonas sp. psych-6C06]
MPHDATKKDCLELHHVKPQYLIRSVHSTVMAFLLLVLHGGRSFSFNHHSTANLHYPSETLDEEKFVDAGIFQFKHLGIQAIYECTLKAMQLAHLQ